MNINSLGESKYLRGYASIGFLILYFRDWSLFAILHEVRINKNVEKSNEYAT
jgi:hypothetical protein